VFSRLTLLAAIVAASPSAFTAPLSPAGARVDAGSRLVLELPASGVGDEDEMELVLSLDGGSTWTVRVTPELEPGRGLLAWRVPALPTTRARLALRAGRGGEDERVLAAGDLFAIVLPPGVPLEPIVRIGPDLSTEEAAGGRLAVFGESGSCRPVEDEVSSGRSGLPLAEGPSAPALPRPTSLRSFSPPLSALGDAAPPPLDRALPFPSLPKRE